MSLTIFREQIEDFNQRLIDAFYLEEDIECIVPHRKLIIAWLQDETNKLKEEKQKNKSEGFISGILNYAGITGKGKTVSLESVLQVVKTIMKMEEIDYDQNYMEEQQLPEEVLLSLKHLKKKKMPSYYAVVSGPLMKGMLLKKKQDFDNCVKQVLVNQLKFKSLGSECAHIVKYQRNTVQQLFERLLNADNQLSTVLKIEVESKTFQKNIEYYCYVQDTKFKSDADWKQLSECKIVGKNRDLAVQVNGKECILNDQSIMTAFLTQMMVVPVQTFVSDYVVVHDGNESRLLKKHKDIEEKDIPIYFKQHPSLRNPLFYFFSFIKFHQYSNKFVQMQNRLQLKDIYANFFEILNILVELMVNDFTFRSGSNKSNSLCLDGNIFGIVWKLFHELVILPQWIQQIINPIKQSVTLFQITNKLHPIFNQIIKLQRQNYDQFKVALLNLPIQNYLTINVSKLNIQKYKDMFVNINSIQFQSLNSKQNIFNQVFLQTIRTYDLHNTNPYEALYFLNFIAKNYSNLFQATANTETHSSWKSKKIWKEIGQKRNQQPELYNYLSVSLDIMAFTFDYDPIQFSNQPFESICNDKQTDQLTNRIKCLISILRSKFQKKSQRYLSLLIQKSFKYKKYLIVKFLIENGVQINNYQDIFTHGQDGRTSMSKLNRHDQKKKLIMLMKSMQPEMFRRYQWQQLINLRLKQQVIDEHVAVLNTIKKGKFYVNKDIYTHLASRSSMNNTISRKDYMFSSNRLIAKVYIQGIQAYIQINEYPLLRYFYSFFLAKLGRASLQLNFEGFFAQKGNLVHLIQCIPKCFNFQKGLSLHSETQLKNYVNEDDISQAIIISMILMPTNVFLKNIIISPETYEGNAKLDRKSVFIVDLYDFYQKNGFQSNSGNILLKVRNSLFLFQEMRNIISQKLMKKYSTINVMELINSVFKQSSSFIIEVNKIKPKGVELQDEEQQLYSLIFQKGFLQSLVERMFKIKCTFQQKLRNKGHISHLQLLQIINPPLSYYYQEIIQSTHKLVEREKILLNQSYKKSFIINDTLINFLPHSCYIEQVKDNFPTHYKRFNFQGPTQNLAHLYSKILKFSVYTEKITDIKTYSHKIIQYFIRNIDLSNYQKEERQSLTNKFQQYSRQYLKRQNNSLPLSIIRISHSDTMKEKNLKFSDQRLKQLIFEEVRCSDSELNNVLRKYQTMSKIVLKNVKGVQKVGEMMMSIASTLEIKNLKYLSIIGCDDLQIVDIKCDQLQQLTFRNNCALTHIYVNSKRIQNMDCSLCPKLRLQNIGIYIFRMINVLLCNNSCDGDVKKLQDQSYSVFLTRILRYLLNRFEESNQYKLQLIITLIKLQLIDEKYFRFGNNKISNNLISLIAKTGLDILTIVQQHIFELLLGNKEVDVLSINQLLKVQMNPLNVICGYLLKRFSKKQFKSIVFSQFIKIPQFYQTHLSIIYQIFQNISVQKTVSLHICLLKDIDQEYYITLIGLLNSKISLEKLQINISNSTITTTFIQKLFALHSRNKIYKLGFVACQISVASDVNFEEQSQLKHIQFRTCKIKQFGFVKKLSQVVSLDVNNCLIDGGVAQLYDTIGSLGELISLSLVELNQGKKDFNIDLQLLFANLGKIKRLQQLNFSGNTLAQDQLIVFSKGLINFGVYQLDLYNFYSAGITTYIQNLLFTQSIKIMSVQFRIQDEQLIESFMDSLSVNKSIIRLNLRSDQEIPSRLFQKIKNNHKLQTILSNQPIPNWLKNHITNNTKNKSCVVEFDQFQPTINSGGKHEDFYRIGLSLDGGGVRGLLLATQLDYLCRHVKQPLHKIFDCVGGTSIGGILALASTGTQDGYNPVCSTKDLMDIFQVYGNKIFKKSQIKQITNLFQTKYDVRSFEELLYSYFKDVKLSDVLSQTNVVITAVNRLTNQDVIFRSLNSIFDRNQDFYMKDIGRATSAAPTYFPSAEIKNINATQKYSLIDGGVGLNNPSKLVIDDIIKMAQNQANKKNYFLLSLGTGRLKNEAIPENAGIKDLAPIIDSFTESANYFIEKDLGQNYRGHYLRVSPDINLFRKDGELDNTRPQILKVYKDTGLDAAEQYFSNTIAFGKYKNQSLIEWLSQNTARKYDL